MNNDLRASWNRLCDSLKESADYIFDPELGVDASEQAEGLRHHLRMLYWAIDRAIENTDPDHPELGWVYPSKVGQDNPDGLYMSAPVDLSRTYRLTGRIDTLRYLGLSLMDLRFGRGRITQLLNLGTPDLTDIGGGRIDVVFSPDPDPGNHIGDWYQMEPQTCRLFVRQFFSDWAAESHAELYLECLDPTGPPARLDPVATAERIDDLADEINTVPKFWTDFAIAQRNMGQVNSFAHVPEHKVDESGLGGSDQQSYGQCWYEVGPDEALLFEVTPPNCLYWNIQVGDTWYQSLDYVNLPTTMNDSQARLDPDGDAPGGDLPPRPRHPELDRPRRLPPGGHHLSVEQRRLRTRAVIAADAGCGISKAASIPTPPGLTADERAALNAERRRHALRRFLR